MRIRVADYIAEFCYEAGIKDVFMVTGGAAMHLNDAFGRAGKFHLRFLHHEQSCAMAAEAYARVTGIPAVVNVTAGPGGINAINGVFGAFVDSLPMIVVSGQSKRETLVRNCNVKGLRQLGDQEVDIVSMVRKVTKYAICVDDPTEIHSIMEKAIREATTGRPGPVWIDVPIDVQASIISLETHSRLKELAIESDLQVRSENDVVSDQIQLLASHLYNARRPVLYVGSGLRLSGVYQEWLEFIDRWNIPVVTAWNSNDLLWDDHPVYVGRPGTVGTRPGNFAVQFSDCVVVLGCRLNIRQISYNWDSFADQAWICHVDIDQAELDKPTLHSDLKICTDLKRFLPQLEYHLESLSAKQRRPNWDRWLIWCRQLLTKYPAFCEEMLLSHSSDGINPYHFIHTLTKNLSEDDIIVCADGSACVVGFQAAVVKRGQRLFHNSGCASMGYELPAAIGAHYATGKRIICLAGDGSIMMNLQELAIIGQQDLPISIYLLNNSGYHSIRQTQQNYFSDNLLGCGIDSGLPFPSFESVARGFELAYRKSSRSQDLQQDLMLSLAIQRPLLHELVIDLDQQFSPKTASRRLDDGTMVSSRLEDMAPFLPHQEIENLRKQALAI